MTPPERGPARRRRFAFLSSLLFCLAACSSDDVRGTYDVELRVQRIGVPILGTLVLGGPTLEVGGSSWVVPNKRGGGPIEDTDDLLLDANSCLVIPREDVGPPRFVMLFEARARSDGIEVPFGVFDTGNERIEVVELRLFANALGGEVRYLEAEGSGEGRLYGDRIRDADGRYCETAFAAYLEARAVEIREASPGAS